MDFKVASAPTGITSLQMDIKVAGLTMDIMCKALAQAKQGRLEILDMMHEAIAAPRGDISKHAPRIVTIRIPTEFDASVRRTERYDPTGFLENLSVPA